jgi:hypothetical protein
MLPLIFRIFSVYLPVPFRFASIRKRTDFPNFFRNISGRLRIAGEALWETMGAVERRKT